MPQLINVTSEALQATIRNLLPSQGGFSEDLAATNLIQPIIDLTPTAEGSILRADLQTAIDFTTAVQSVENSSATLASSAGFYRVFGNVTNTFTSSGRRNFDITLDDGATTNIIYNVHSYGGSSNDQEVTSFDFVVFLNQGISLKMVSDNSEAHAEALAKQIASFTGVLVQPQGFVSE
jgi:hypothetical protein